MQISSRFLPEIEALLLVSQKNAKEEYQGATGLLSIVNTKTLVLLDCTRKYRSVFRTLKVSEMRKRQNLKKRKSCLHRFPLWGPFTKEKEKGNDRDLHWQNLTPV